MDKARTIAVGVALLAAVFIPLYFMGVALSVKFGVVPWQFGLGVLLFKGAPIVLFGSLALAVIAVLLAFLVQPRGGRIASIIAILIPLAGLAAVGMTAMGASKIPPIHDISTDIADRPTFSAKAIAKRGHDANPLDATTIMPGPRTPPAIAGKSIFDLQRTAYPDVKPMTFAVPPNVAFDSALEVLQAQKISITNADKSAGVIEGVAETFWFGFKDDVIVRVRPTTQGSVIDIRSVSRVGVSDLGTNAKRIRTLLRSIKMHLSAD